MIKSREEIQKEIEEKQKEKEIEEKQKLSGKYKDEDEDGNGKITIDTIKDLKANWHNLNPQSKTIYYTRTELTKAALHILPSIITNERASVSPEKIINKAFMYARIFYKIAQDEVL